MKIAYEEPNKGPSKKSQEARQTKIVAERDGYRCQFEKKTKRGWEPCGVKSNGTTAHLIRRPHCIPVMFEPDLAIRGCLSCHTAFDAYALHVRAPYDRALRAWELAVERCIVKPPSRYNPETDPRYAEMETIP